MPSRLHGKDFPFMLPACMRRYYSYIPSIKEHHMDQTNKPNSARSLWEAFRQTGRVSAYIAYRNALKQERDEKPGGQGRA